MLFYHPSSTVLPPANSFSDSSTSPPTPAAGAIGATASSSTTTSTSASNSASLVSRPRIVLDTHQLDNIASSITQSQLVNLDNNHYSVDHLRLGKASAYRNSPSSNYNYDYRPQLSSSAGNSVSLMFSYSNSSSSNSPWTDDHYHHQAHTPTHYEDSPTSSPQDSQARPPVSFPQPLSAPHNQPTFPHQYSSRYSSDKMQYLDGHPVSSLDRRMSEPALLSVNHPTAYRVPPSSEQPNRYSNPYATSSTYSPPDLHAVSRPSYAGHSRNDSGGSSVGTTYPNESRSYWTANVKQEDTYADINTANPLSYSPRPSTGSGSTGVERTSPLPNYSLSAASPTSGISISPDMPATSVRQSPEHPAQGDYHQLSSPSGSNKTYAFVSLPGTTIRKRPRRRYDEIERLYHCSWPNCTKAYGTLNHLNAHVVMQKHGPRRLPAEFKELRKQWRKAKKEGTFTPPTANSTHRRSSTPPSPRCQYSSQNPYYAASGVSSANERRRRMTDPNSPPIAAYRSPNSYGQSMHGSSNLGGSGWVEDTDRRYAASLAFSSNENTVVEEVYGSYSNSSLTQPDEETLGGYRQLASSTNMTQPGYSIQTQSNNQDHYGQGYTYALPSPASQQQNVPSSASPPSPPSHHRYSTGTSLPPISSATMPLNRLQADGTLLSSLNDYRNSVMPAGDSKDNRDVETPGSRSTGSEYDEPKGSYALHSHPQQNHTYGYDEYENDGDAVTGPYLLGRNRLPRDSTLLTPLNLEHLRYGNGKGV